MLITVFTKDIKLERNYVSLGVKDIMLALAYETKEVFVKFEETPDILCKVNIDMQEKRLNVIEIAETDLDFSKRNVKRVAFQEYVPVDIICEDNYYHGNVIDLSLKAIRINTTEVIKINTDKECKLSFKLKNKKLEIIGKLFRKEGSDLIFNFELDSKTEDIISSYMAEVEMKLIKELKNKYTMIFEG
ncbi:PilZ domain-containing protein [Hydrogenivirga sp. 128-5-R1-1]|uniref:PilZ domain-containing protein n=1 Tax=Hydrogenivirga sp. 128-5-R1-1 TaxID=392423 RepID=UPI00015EFEA2|nr:PilZ domain-containing protein [Hydrogenivirga sp. 128-5-R1-1]EDP74162.1 hypothetical protein HG1285_11837 [Hydrogenivirga sp. 128-5-R1-1]